VIQQFFSLLLVALTLGAHPSGASLEERRVRASPTVAYQTARDAFGLLRGQAEDLPRHLQSHLAKILSSGTYRLTPRAVQHRRIAGQSAWVFLDRNMICLSQGHGGGAACSTAGNAAKAGISLGVFSPPNRRYPKPHDFSLLGLAPDGISRVVIAIGGRAHTIPVKTNLYTASAEQPIIVRRYVREGH